jgi:hypothetical protein
MHISAARSSNVLAEIDDFITSASMDWRSWPSVPQATAVQPQLFPGGLTLEEAAVAQDGMAQEAAVATAAPLLAPAPVHLKSKKARSPNAQHRQSLRLHRPAVSTSRVTAGSYSNLL